MSIINFSFRPIGSYIQESIYWIPDYQREYSWDTEDQVDDFWRDLESVINENRDQHFFGQIVVHASKQENKKYIIDGQQRTSTTIIFLSVVHHLFEQIYMKFEYKNARNRCEDIRLKFIGRCSEDENELKLYLGKIDREYFADNIQAGIPDKDSIVPSHRRIKSAYNYIQKKLEEKIKGLEKAEDIYEKLFLYYSSFIEKFKIMYVETDDINEAFIIFETLNARGKDLETADLLKNHIFRIAGDRIKVVSNNWQSLLESLDSVDSTKFIRHFWNSRCSFTREKDLYKKIRDTIISPIKSEEFTINMIKSAEVYKALTSPKEEIFFNNNKLNKSLLTLKNMNASSFYPIILAMHYAKFQEEDIAEVTRSIEILILRNCVVAGKVANKYEVIFAKVALNIYDEDYTTKEEIINRIQKDIISDEEFINSFSIFKSRKKVIIRYILRSINNYFNNEVEVIEDNEKIHIEHIMPKSKGEWDIDDEQHKEYLWRLGNLTLLGAEYNRRNCQRLFPYKKDMYSKSKIDISNKLLGYSEWTINQIEDRQKKLAQVAVKVWSI